MSSHTRKRRARVERRPQPGGPEPGLRVVIVYKLVKACGELLLAGVLGAVLLGGPEDRVGALAVALREHVSAAWGARVTELFVRAASPRNVALTAGALSLDGVWTLFEGWALYRRFVWAPWLVVIATGLLVPLELLELAQRPRAGRFLMLAVNLAVVWYLARHAIQTSRD